MKRSISIYKVLGLFVLLAFLTGCAAENTKHHEKGENLCYYQSADYK